MIDLNERGLQVWGYEAASPVGFANPLSTLKYQDASSPEASFYEGSGNGANTTMTRSMLAATTFSLP